MPTATDHYSSLLAPIYLWMAGGLDTALAQGATDVAALGHANAANRTAVDLGAGFGMHAIPLARNGYAVTAIDSSPLLLAQLREHSAGLAIETIEADLLDLRAHLASQAALVVCMGDTVTHLQEIAQVERLIGEVAQALAPRGRFLLTFRDYTKPPTGDARFIHVRSDADRIHTCFLEEAPLHMVVHDILHVREGAVWQMRVSSYKKLRLSPAWLLHALEQAGFTSAMENGPRGMIRVTATI